MRRLAALIIAAAAAGYGLHALAQSRFDVRPAMAPIGTSSSNGISFAWFYDPTERAVYGLSQRRQQRHGRVQGEGAAALNAAAARPPRHQVSR